ncbi:hypothetical protein [Sandarakinorhabdus rubra]|uniref:hypothetical protein n=1 Tax=Sandarakinorhabdus rubra TaxID=2672568 RepID=UPI0013D9A18D|nr:hypothetical protein [Sandarakinorhabdus rubra]
MHGGPPRPRRVEEPVRQQAVAYGYAVATWCFGIGAAAVLIEALALGVDADRITWIAALTGPAAMAFLLKRLWLPDRVERGARYWLFAVPSVSLAFFSVMWMFRALGRML